MSCFNLIVVIGPECIVPTRDTKASVSNAKSFRPKKSLTSTYQHSFFKELLESGMLSPCS